MRMILILMCTMWTFHSELTLAFNSFNSIITLLAFSYYSRPLKVIRCCANWRGIYDFIILKIFIHQSNILTLKLVKAGSGSTCRPRKKKYYRELAETAYIGPLCDWNHTRPSNAQVFTVVTNHATASPLQIHPFLVSCTLYTIPILRIFDSKNFYLLATLQCSDRVVFLVCDCRWA